MATSAAAPQTERPMRTVPPRKIAHAATTSTVSGTSSATTDLSVETRLGSKGSTQLTPRSHAPRGNAVPTLRVEYLISVAGLCEAGCRCAALPSRGRPHRGQLQQIERDS